MKIAIFTDTFTPQVNGVAKTLERFTQHLQRRGTECYVFAPRHTAEESFVSNIKKLRSIPFSLYPECRLALPNPSFIYKELRRLQPDLIHVATPFNLGIYGLYYAKKLNIPLVGSYHTDFDSYLRYYKIEFLSRALWRYIRWFHSYLEKTFVPSSETLLQLKQKGFRNLHIWSRGVDCQLYHPNYNQETVRQAYNIQAKYILSYVGRLAPEKDIETLLTVMQQTREQLGDAVHWLIVGDGPLLADIQMLRQPNITCTGYLQDEKLAAIYAASDLMVFPSPTETFGNVVLESLACGTPVIGAHAGGVKTIIQHGKTGYLCEPKQADLFSDAIQQLLSCENKRTSMGQLGREYALSKSWDAVFEQLLNDYQAVLHSSQNELLA